MVFKIDYAGAVFGGNGSIMLATTKTKGGVCVKKSIYHIQNKINTWF